MNLSKKFEELIIKQLESCGCSMGVTNLVMYIASAKEGTKASFEMIGQWPQIDRLLTSIEDDPSLKVSSPNRRWYPLLENDILLGVLRVETDLKGGNWPVSLDSRLKALSISLAKCVSIELERQNKNEEINYLKNQVNVIIHQLRNPLAALRTYAKLLIKRLGSDDDSIEIVETNTIGALLGSKNILKSLYAAISGLIFVGIFMIFNYRILGFVSVLSLVLYGFFNLALYSLIPVTLTLPGISGLILSIGMAVDANILIFERIREELYDGNTLTRSIDSGFQRANSSKVDGHNTTLLSCIVLFLLGTNFVKGFAATLGIGVLISLFTSLNCSKTILRFFITYQSLRHKNLYLPKNNFSN